MNYKISEKQAKQFAYLIKNDIHPYIRTHWEEYIQFLETEDNQQAKEELEMIRAGTHPLQPQ